MKKKNFLLGLMLICSAITIASSGNAYADLSDSTDLTVTLPSIFIVEMPTLKDFGTIPLIDMGGVNGANDANKNTQTFSATDSYIKTNDLTTLNARDIEITVGSAVNVVALGENSKINIKNDETGSIANLDIIAKSPSGGLPTLGGVAFSNADDGAGGRKFVITGSHSNFSHDDANKVPLDMILDLDESSYDPADGPVNGGLKFTVTMTVIGVD